LPLTQIEGGQTRTLFKRAYSPEGR